jgi:glutathione synthase/RimK-type ligase-like ATP-grasp enzyme
MLSRPKTILNTVEMADMIVLGIYREKMFSPGRVGDDAEILETTVEELASRGHSVRTLSAETLDGQRLEADCVLSMAKSKGTLARLEEWQERGARVINGIPSVRNCLRSRLFRLLPEAGLPVPEGTILPVDQALDVCSFRGSTRYWLKRGDVHSVNPGDVVKVSTYEETVHALDHFRRSGIEQVLVQEHVDGESIKFYAIAASRFFRAFCFSRNREDVTDRMGRLRSLADRAGDAAGLEIFGGDAIVTPDGQVFLIDLNDWPSFASCRDSAAQHIAAYVADSLE